MSHPTESPDPRARGELFIVSAPSGAGKTTLINRLLQSELVDDGRLVFSVSHTTRAPRRGEVDGQDYHFVSRGRFQAMVAEDRFLEWAEVHNNLYGTSVDEVVPRLDAGVDVILDIDVQGARSVMARRPEAHTIFILPPSHADLEKRLRRRGLDDPVEIDHRLEVALSEIRCYGEYDYVILNDDAQSASDVLAAIILEKRHQTRRMRGRVEAVLAGFPEPELA